MTSVLRELMLGKRPIRRTNPKSGQSEWYYMGPNGIEIDVENENSPNPYEAAIKNYWAQNDDYNYKLVYGNTPPPSSAQTQTIGSVTDVNNLNNQTSSDILQGVQSNSSTWDKVKNFAQNAVNSVAPYTPTYYAGYGIATAQNTFNKLKNLYRAYKQNGATYAAQQYGEPSVKKAAKAAEWLAPIPMSDVNKHRYVSCIGSTDGLLAAAETLGGGVKKEFDDYKKKTNNATLLEEYGGKTGVIHDNFKDFINDLKGIKNGYLSDDPNDCEKFLLSPFRNTKYW